MVVCWSGKKKKSCLTDLSHSRENRYCIACFFSLFFTSALLDSVSYDLCYMANINIYRKHIRTINCTHAKHQKTKQKLSRSRSCYYHALFCPRFCWIPLQLAAFFNFILYTLTTPFSRTYSWAQVLIDPCLKIVYGFQHCLLFFFLMWHLKKVSCAKVFYVII